MRNILDKIILEKKKYINQLKEIIDIKSLEQSEYFEIETYSLKNKIIKEDSFGIISEFKRKSPSFLFFKLVFFQYFLDFIFIKF